MFKHHLLLAFRNFKRYKVSFFINLFGLSTGLACALLIYFWVNDELNMDKFHAGSDRLYQVMISHNEDNGINVSDITPGPLGKALSDQIPGVEAAASTFRFLSDTKMNVAGNAIIKADGKAAGEHFFKIFSYPLVSGTKANVLRDKNTIAVSKNLALKLFGSTNVLGRQLNWKHGSMSTERHALISGVFQDIPGNSSDRFDYVIPLETLTEANPDSQGWGTYAHTTYLLLKKGADHKAVESQIRDFLVAKGEKKNKLFIRSYADGYLYGDYKDGKASGGRIEYVQLFSLIAVFILVIACINFMNLSTAQASRRLKEVGIKKVIGANRGTLFIQYMAESIILTLCSLAIAMLLVELILPQFNQITGKQLTRHVDQQLLWGIFLITSVTGLVSGSYPALYLSGLNPTAALKGRLNSSLGELWTRRSLVIFQFAISVILIVSVVVIYKQIDYVQKSNVGFKKDNLVHFEAEGRLKGNTNLFIEAAKQIPGVINAAGFRGSFIGSGFTSAWQGHNPEREVGFRVAGISIGAIETLGMEMVKGRSFSSQFGPDSNKVILNEAGAKALGFKNPIGKTFSMWDRNCQIIGVVKDFNFESMHQAVRPMFFWLESLNNSRVLIRIKAGAERETISELTAMYQKFNPGLKLEYKFMDEDYQSQYIAENRVSVLSKYFAGLAIVISCLGLFGLAAFTAERRLKEIGIRKILGASEMSVIVFLSKDFLKPVLISVFIALPVSYLLASRWLDSFAYRMELNLWYFAVAGMLSILISWLTVSMQAFKAARLNPIQCIKTN
ncbi:MAG: ABC transporter permease [Bacteroidota bacterium]